MWHKISGHLYGMAAPLVSFGMMLLAVEAMYGLRGWRALLLRWHGSLALEECQTPA